MTTASRLTAVPHPVQQSQFYQGVPFKRAIAWVIDSVTIALISTLALPFTAFTGLLFFPALMLVIGFIYRWFSLSVLSATPGMRLMSIELREGWGQRLSNNTALLHVAGYTISVLAAPLQLISVVLIGTTAKGQGLTDMFLNTVAINRSARH